MSICSEMRERDNEKEYQHDLMLQAAKGWATMVQIKAIQAGFIIKVRRQ